MLDTDLVKTLLKHGAFEQCRDRLKPSLFAEDVRDAYEILVDAHDKYGHDLTPKELLTLWKAQNPVATKAEIGDMRELFDNIDTADDLADDVVLDTVDLLWKRDVGKRIATLGLRVSEGEDAAMQSLRDLLERTGDSFAADDFGDPTTQDLDELLGLLTDDHRFQFNIETLSRRVYGIGRAEFGVVFATPETGKTAFLVSLAFGPGGWIDQGLKVLFLGNEERTTRTVVRAYQSCTGFTGEQIQEDPEKAKAIYRAKTEGRAVFKDVQDWDLNKIDAYIGKIGADVVIVDQLDKVQIGGKFERGHERLREVYRLSREVAKRRDCAFIGVSQASNDATGKTVLTYDMMEGSKIGKAAEADLIIGIGKRNSQEDEEDNDRYLHVSKNKLSGWHGTVIAQIEPKVSRYVA